MQVVIEIPDSIAGRMEAKWGNIEKRALELLAADGYRVEAITHSQVGQLLELSRYQVDGFLKQEKAYLHYTEADLEQDRQTMRELTTELVAK